MPAKKTAKKAAKKTAKATPKKAAKKTTKKTVKAVSKKAPKKTKPKKTAAKERKGDSYECGICGYRLIVDEVCGCVDEHVFVCCNKVMKGKKAKKKK
jgi:hypothetical protein